jgi:CopG family transcriptional regulator, nickel-responsive regulator
MKLTRFGVSLQDTLIKKFDRLIKKKKYSNRSEAIRDLIRRELVQEEIKSDQQVAGVLNILFDHHKTSMSDKLNSIQHDYFHNIISSTHIHLDHDNCLEVIILKGKSKDIREISDRIIAIKGVKHGELSMTSLGKKLI